MLQADNIERAAVFYESVLKVRGERVGPGRHEFNLGGVTLCCVDPASDGQGSGAGSNPDLLCIAVDDLEAAYARAERAGCQWLDGIETKAWGERSFTLRDPFGNPICLADAASLRVGARDG